MIPYLITHENPYHSASAIKIRSQVTPRWQNALYVSLLKNDNTLIFQDQSQIWMGKEMLWPSALNILVRQKGQKAIGVLFLLQM